MKLQNHYKDGFFDVCAEHGFLPVKDPIVSLPSTYADVQKILDDMPVVLPTGERGLLHLALQGFDHRAHLGNALVDLPLLFHRLHRQLCPQLVGLDVGLQHFPFVLSLARALDEPASFRGEPEKPAEQHS